MHLTTVEDYLNYLQQIIAKPKFNSGWNTILSNSNPTKYAVDEIIENTKRMVMVHSNHA